MSKLTWHNHRVSQDMRITQHKQKPCLLWFTGLSGAGKSTLANFLELELVKRGYHTYLLDGDNLRHGLNQDLGFTDRDRVENIRRVGEVSKLFVDAGLITLSAFISPFMRDRRRVRALFNVGEFIEVYVSTPIAECERRDPKALYKKARAGEIKNFTGIDSPYEPPESPELVIDTTLLEPAEGAAIMTDYLQQNGILRKV